MQTCAVNVNVSWRAKLLSLQDLSILCGFEIAPGTIVLL